MPSLSLSQQKLAFPVLMALILLFGIFLRSPFISEGLPYFYREDEAHHFDRVANMAKSGDLNPHYFLKPSLHFYLRLPVLAASFIQSVRRGHIRSVEEIITADPYGLGGYAFNASHPGLVRANRLFSLVLNLGCILLAALIAFELTHAAIPAVLAAFLCAISPSFVSESAVIGVDVVMGFLCVLTSYLALRFLKSPSASRLWLCGITAGLAISSKYNALPVALVPLLICLLAPLRSSPHAICAALAGPVAGFFLGTPYAITSIPLFLDHMAQEVWHYGVAVHGGHTAEPGIPQALFYLRWFNNEALGPVATAFGTVGVVTFAARNFRAHAVFLLFPALFAALMISQKTNFERNMLVMIPYVCVIAGVTVYTICDLLNLGTRVRRLVAIIFVILAGFMPIELSLQERAQAANRQESRLAAEQFIRETSGPIEDVAAAGALQFQRNFLTQPGVSRIDSRKSTLLDLALAGFSRAILPSEAVLPSGSLDLWKKEREFPGRPVERIVENPALAVWRFDPSPIGIRTLADYLRSRNQNLPSIDLASAEPRLCAPQQGEDYCWLVSRLTVVELKNIPTTAEGAFITLSFSAISPWPKQEVTVSTGEFLEAMQLESPGQWQQVEVRIPLDSFKLAPVLELGVKEVHVPAEYNLSGDTRRLGLAVRDFSAKG